MGSKENGTPAPKTKQVPAGAGIGGGGGGGGGLFDEEEEDDDFFSGKSLKKSDSGKCVRMDTSVLQSKFRWDPHLLPSFSAGKEKPKKAIDLFDEEDEDGDIFNEKYSTPTPAQSKKEVVEEQVKQQPEKKVKIKIQCPSAVEYDSNNSFVNYIFCLVYLHECCSNKSTN